MNSGVASLFIRIGMGRFGRMLFLAIGSATLFALIGATLLFLVIDWVEIGNLSAARSSDTNVLVLSLYNLPRVVRAMLPVVAPIGAAVAIGTLVRRREMHAVLAAGASPVLVIGPLSFVALLLGSVQAINQEWIVPKSARAVGELRRDMGLGAGPLETHAGRQTWFTHERGLVHVAKSDSSTTALDAIDLLVLEFKNGRVDARWDGRRIVPRGEHLIAKGARKRTFADADTITVEDTFDARMPFGGVGFGAWQISAAPERLGLLELLAVSNSRRQLGRTTAAYDLESLRRVVAPFEMLVSLVLAAASILRSPRRPSLGHALAIGGGIGLFVWLSNELGTLLATHGACPPLLAVGFPLALLLAISMTLGSRAMRLGLMVER